jgi:hypothetical protein
MPGITRISMLVVLMCLMWSFSATAFADEGSTAEVVQLVRAGNDAFDAEDYEEAYRLYSAALELLPEEAIRYRLGQSAMYLGWTRQAVMHFEVFLQEGDEDEERLARVEGWLPDLRANLPAILAVQVAPEGASVYLLHEDGERLLGTSPGEFEVGPGAVRLQARAAGYEAQEWESEVEADDRIEWQPTLVAKPSSVELDEEPLSVLPIAGWASAGVGVALLVTGGAFSFLQSQATEQVNSYDKRAEGATAEELEALRSNALSYNRAARVTYIAGAVLTAAGIGVLVYDGMQGDSNSTVSLRIDLGSQGAFLSMGRRF